MKVAIQFLMLALCFYNIKPASAIEIRAAVHVHTAWSGGALKPAEVAALAKEKKLDAVFLTDHDLMRAGYGLPPFENLAAVWKDRDSVLDLGVEKYLSEVKAAEEATGVLMVPGAESSPHHHWKGYPWSNLSLEGWTRHILLLGLDSPASWNNLPIPRNFKRLAFSRMPHGFMLAAFAGFALCTLLTLRAAAAWEKRLAKALALLNLLILGHLALSPSTPWPVQGRGGFEAGWAPHQEIIDYARSVGALSVWAHPDMEQGEKTIQDAILPIAIPHGPYPEALSETQHYVGFEGLAGTPPLSAEPGFAWDKALKAATQSNQTPPWIFAAQDFKEESDSSWLGEFQVVIEAEKFSIESCLSAMETGRFYSVRRSKENLLSLSEYTLNQEGVSVGSGETMLGDMPSTLNINLSSEKPMPITIRIIQNGEVIQSLTDTTPVKLNKILTPPKNGEISYLRVDAAGVTGNRIFSNPIFWRSSAAKNSL